MSTRAGYAGRSGGPALPGGGQHRLLDSGVDQRVAAVPGRIRRRPAEPPACPRSSEIVPTDKQRRQAAQRHLQKQLERRAEETARRRRTVAIVATAVSVLVVLGAVLLLTGVFEGDEPTDTASGSNSPDTVSCTYTPDESGNPNLT